MSFKEVLHLKVTSLNLQNLVKFLDPNPTTMCHCLPRKVWVWVILPLRRGALNLKTWGWTQPQQGAGLSLLITLLAGRIVGSGVKCVTCTMVSRVHMTFCIIIKGYTVPGNQGTHDKLNQIQNMFHV